MTRQLQSLSLCHVALGRKIVFQSKKGGYTKNYRTGIRLCQCGHLYDVEATNTRDESGKLYIRAKCRPTMRKAPPFYVQFVVENQKPVGGNCFCAAGASQSCVHICDRLQNNRAQRGTLRKIFFCTYRVVGVQTLSSPSFIVVA